MNIDSRQFYTQLYEATLQLDACMCSLNLLILRIDNCFLIVLFVVSQKEDIILAMDCLDRMMRKRREVSFKFCAPKSPLSFQLMCIQQ